MGLRQHHCVRCRGVCVAVEWWSRVRGEKCEPSRDAFPSPPPTCVGFVCLDLRIFYNGCRLMSLPTSPSLHATLLVPHGRPVYAPLAPRVSLCARARQLLTFCCKWSCLALMTFVFVSSSGCPFQPSP